MKAVKRITYAFMVLAGLSGAAVVAQPSTAASYQVVSGSVTVTPARCISRPCVPTTSSLSGSLTAEVTSGRLLFPSSTLKTDPEAYFTLPVDPEEDANGEVREVSFQETSNSLNVKGFIDSRAFDGPLVEYTFVARTGDARGVSFYTATPDLAQCAPPACGGYYVKAVNKLLTRCADGKLQNQCYVAEVVLGKERVNATGSLGNSTPLLLQGAIEPYSDGPFKGYGKFAATAAYRSATDQTAVGKFVGLENNGIVCISSPCFSYDKKVLNTSQAITKLSTVNLELSGASAADIEQASSILANGGTVYATGTTYKYRGFSGRGVGFEAQQFYLPLKVAPTCPEGYSPNGGECKTPFGCVYPLIEQTTVGGAPMKDPITGEIKGSIFKSCVKQCPTGPGPVVHKPGQCTVYMP